VIEIQNPESVEGGLMKIIAPVPSLLPAAPARTSIVETDVRPTSAVILRNSWPAMRTIAAAVSDRLSLEHGFELISEESFPTSSRPPDDVLERAATAGDIVVIGVAT
jgi:hypothetical protein